MPPDVPLSDHSGSVVHGNYRVSVAAELCADTIPPGRYDPVLLADALLRAGWTPPEPGASDQQRGGSDD